MVVARVGICEMYLLYEGLGDARVGVIRFS